MVQWSMNGAPRLICTPPLNLRDPSPARSIVQCRRMLPTPGLVSVSVEPARVCCEYLVESKIMPPQVDVVPCAVKTILCEALPSATRRPLTVIEAPIAPMICVCWLAGHQHHCPSTPPMSTAWRTVGPLRCRCILLAKHGTASTAQQQRGNRAVQHCTVLAWANTALAATRNAAPPTRFRHVWPRGAQYACGCTRARQIHHHSFVWGQGPSPGPQSGRFLIMSFSPRARWSVWRSAPRRRPPPA